MKSELIHAQLNLPKIVVVSMIYKHQFDQFYFMILTNNKTIFFFANKVEVH